MKHQNLWRLLSIKKILHSNWSKRSNIRLASKLSGWDLNIISSEEAEAKEKVDETEFLGKLVASLEISEESAESIIELGLRSFDDIAYASKKKLSNILKMKKKSKE